MVAILLNTTGNTQVNCRQGNDFKSLFSRGRLITFAGRQQQIPIMEKVNMNIVLMLKVGYDIRVQQLIFSIYSRFIIIIGKGSRIDMK